MVERETGLHTMSGTHTYRLSEDVREELWTERNEWVAAFGVRPGDVFEDDVGEFIWVEPNLMDDGDEPEDAKPYKVRLPSHLQTHNING